MDQALESLYIAFHNPWLYISDKSLIRFFPVSAGPVNNQWAATNGVVVRKGLTDLSTIYYLFLLLLVGQWIFPGYMPLNVRKKDSHQLIYESILKALEWNLGLQVSTTIVNRLRELAGLSEKELLMNYDLFEKSLRKTLGEEATAKILGWVKYQALIEAVVNDSSLNENEIADPNLTINDILRDIDSVHVFEFIRNLPAHEHVLFLYTNEEIKKRRCLHSSILQLPKIIPRG